jgi:hypothetical protein
VRRRRAARMRGAGPGVYGFLPLPWAWISAGVVIWAAAPADAGATALEGKVVNGTTEAPGRCDWVALTSLGAGMDEVARLEDVQGDFLVESEALEAGGPFLLQASYRQVTYSQVLDLEPGRPPPPVEIQVYEVTESAAAISVTIPHILVRRVAEDRLLINKTYRITNHSHPLETFYSAGGTFRLPFPGPAADVERFTYSSGTVPLEVSPQPTEEPGIVAIDHPIRPGVSQVDLAYEVEYLNETYHLSEPILYPTDIVGVFLHPGDFEAEGEGLEDLGYREEVNAQVYRATDPPVGTSLTLDIAGGSLAAPGAGSTAGGSPGVRVILVPSRTRDMLPFLAGGLALLLFGGALYLYREHESGRRDLLSRKKVYLEDLIELEERHRNDGIPEKEFARESAQIRRKLRKVLAGLEAHEGD